MLVELGHYNSYGFIDAAFNGHGVDSGGDAFETFAVDAFGQECCGGGAVAGDVAGLGGNFLDHLGAHVFVGVFELDFFGHGDPVLGNCRRPEAFIDDDVAAFGSQCYFNSPAELLDAAEDCLAGIGIEF